MSLLFVDGFDHIGSAENLTKKYGNYSGTLSFIEGRRVSSSALKISVTSNSSSGYLDKTLPAPTSTVVCGFAYFTSTSPYDLWSILRFYDPAISAQFTVAITAARTLCLYRGTTSGTLLATSTKALLTGTWNYIEVKASVADSGGLLEVRVNGEVWVSYTGDTKATSYSTVTVYRLYGTISGTYSNYVLYDDFYLCDGSGATNNDYLGDCRVDTLLPTEVGNYSQFTPTGSANNWANVDEVPPDSDTSYNSGDTVGTKDSFGVSALSGTGATIFGIQANLIARKDDAGTRTLMPLVRSGGTDANGAAQSLTDSYVDQMTIFETDPTTSAAWTESTINAAEFGYEVAA